MYRKLSIFAAFVYLFFSEFSLVSFGAEGSKAKKVLIPVTINIYKTGSGDATTESVAKSALSHASKILKQANIQLKLRKIEKSVTKGDDGDGKLTLDEVLKVIDEGNKVVNSGKDGIKVCFVEQPTKWIPKNPGASIHKNPTVVVKDRGDTQKTGRTLAHEILHALTLSEKYLIGKDKNRGNEEVYSDEDGHAPEKPKTNGRKYDSSLYHDNIMAPSNYRTGEKITDQQKKKIFGDGYVQAWGKAKVEKPPAGPKKEKQQKGAVKDSLEVTGIVPLRHLDIDQVSLWSVDSDPLIHGLITFFSPFPLGESFSASYEILWDIDPELPGPERQALISVKALGPEFQPTITTQVIDLPTETFLGEFEEGGLGQGRLALDISTEQIQEPVQGQIEFSIGKELLGIEEREMPVVVRVNSYAELGILVDSTEEFLFDPLWWQGQPDLILEKGEAYEGENLFFHMSGFAPSTQFRLYIDEEPVLEAMTAKEGTFMGQFSFEAVSALVDDFYFITAVDSEGNMGFDIVKTLLPLYIGDANNDGKFDIADPISTLTYLFASAEGPSKNPPCLASMDANNDGAVDIADPIKMLAFLFIGEPMKGPGHVPIPPGEANCKLYLKEDVKLPCEQPCTPE